MQRFLSIAITCFLCVKAATAQNIKQNEPFPFERIAHYFPDLKIEKGKATIVDLFSSGCIHCFTSLPKLKEIKKMNAQNLQILLLGDKRRNAEYIYGKYNERFELKLPVVFESEFTDWVDPPFQPYFIWIDQRGMVRGLTGSPDVTDKNVEKLLHGGTVVKNDGIVYLRGGPQPIVLDSSVLGYSELREWKITDPADFPSAFHSQSDQIQIAGAELSHLYMLALAGDRLIDQRDSLYGKFYPKPLWESADSLSEVATSTLRYNYTLALREQLHSTQLAARMLSDLNFQTPYTGAIENRMMPYWKLVAINGDTARLSTRHPKKRPVVNYAKIQFTNHSVSDLLSNITYFYTFGPPILDETGMKGNIDIDLECVLSDFEGLRNGLRTAGLDLVVSSKMMNVVVIRKKPSVTLR